MKTTTRRLLGFVLLGLPLIGQTDRQIELAKLEHFRHWGYSSVSFNWEPISAEDASRLENQLRSDPEDLAARVRLLNYYWHDELWQERAQSVLWLISRHPASPVLGLDIAWIRTDSDQTTGAGFIQARQLWASSIVQYGEVPEVLHNAARFFEEADPATSAQLARRLQSIDPAGHGKVVEYYFSKVAPAARR
jgi:hypothetical protein